MADVPHRGVGIVGRIGDVGGGIRAGTPVIAAARGEQEEEEYSDAICQSFTYHFLSSLNGQFYRATAIRAVAPCHATGIDRYLKAVEGDGNIVGVLIAGFPFGVFL